MTRREQSDQRRASNPGLSAWVAANAGSGKTHVLVERIARLLLAGTRPNRLLCLTFTRAAASEMSVRLFRRLGDWTLMDDDALSEALHALTGDAVTPDDLTRARRLFAEALESPGGLRIQTIHAFCERLLKRFPLEAGVVPQFSVLDDRMREALLNDARDHVLGAAALHDRELHAEIQALSEHAGAEGFDRLLRSITGQRGWVEAFLRGRTRAAIADDVWRAVNLDPGVDADAILADTLRLFDDGKLRRVAAALLHGGKTDVANSAAFRALADRRDGDALEAVMGALLTDDGTVRKRLATQAAIKADAGLPGILDDMAALVLAYRRKRNALFIATSSTRLLQVAREILDVFREKKLRLAMMDYDDLIERTSALFESPGAAWVLYKLDGGIDHILVDEAQDTSPSQWNIITPIASEFFSGIGAERGGRPLTRTIFAVGDVKQSIMSFQGAQPQWFIATRERVRQEAEGANAIFERVQLQKSFRTAPAILELVDAVLSDADVRDGVVIGDEEALHTAHRSDMPGLVELWPAVAWPEQEMASAWDAPRDRVTSDHPAVTLAATIARRIDDWLHAGTAVHDKASGGVRPIGAGDIMILVRRRDLLAEEIIRQLKRLGIPVAGADRLNVPEHIAVMDLVALGRFVLMQDDDLSLAAVLRSPLCGISEEALFDLAHERGTKTLWMRMRERPHDTRWRAAFQFLERAVREADVLQPYEFYSMVVGELGGWTRILSRLGPDAADPVEEFMNAALDFGRGQTPSLEAFLHTVETTESELKRDQDRSEGAVRVLTVHASKGLEAPVVILPDTWTTPSDGKFDKDLLRAGDVPLWKLDSGRDEPVRQAARELDRLERMREYQRLLYVGLTRARDRLHVCGYQGKREPDPQRWHAVVDRAMDRLGAQQVEYDGDMIKRLGTVPGRVPARASSGTKVMSATLPTWTGKPADAETVIARLTPSQKAARRRSGPSTGGSGQGVALDRGRAVHEILDAIGPLPAAAWGGAATRIALKHAGSAELAQEVVREALAVRRNPAFGELFGPGSHGEVPVRGVVTWRGERVEISARIDRAVMSPGGILLVEFKTDRVVPQSDAGIPAAYVEQMALYRLAVATMFPGRTVSCGILWTAEASLMAIPASMLDAAGLAP